VIDSLIFPVGHYLGANHAAIGAELDSHIVRVGWRLERLDRIEQFAVWALAHGLPEGGDMAPWTRGAAEGAARASGIPHVAATLTELAGLDLIVDVVPETPDAVEFAKSCRVRALLSGVGEIGDDSGRFGIGWAGAAPVVQVDAFTYEIWKWGPACDSLWHLCEMLSYVAPESGDPDEVLNRTLSSLQILLAHGAAFLDEAREEVELEPSASEAGTLSD
jgi:hypothetical protein